MCVKDYGLYEMTNDVYVDNGFVDRQDYLDSLSEEYGEDVVSALTSIFPATEDFDGLIVALDDSSDVI